MSGMQSIPYNNWSKIEWLLWVNGTYIDLSKKRAPMGSVTLWFPEACRDFDSLIAAGDFVEHGKTTENSNVQDIGSVDSVVIIS